jgi:flagellar biosynthetic protein FliO
MAAMAYAGGGILAAQTKGSSNKTQANGIQTQGTGVSSPQAIDETKLEFSEARQDTGAESQAKAPATNLWIYLRTVLVLAFVVALIYFTLRFIKKASKPKGQGSENIRVLSSLPLGPKSCLYLVAVGSEVFFLGSTEGSIRPIADLKDREFIDSLLLRELDKGEPVKADFASMIRNALGIKPKRGQEGGSDFSLSMDFLQGQKDRLKKF